MTETSSTAVDIAVIGMSCRFPGAEDPNEFWRNLREGVESIRTHTDETLLARGVSPETLKNPRYVKASAPLDDAEGFDAAFFGFSAREAELMDPQHRHFLECAYAALEDAGYDSSRYGGLVGVYAGSTMNTYLPMNLMSQREVLDVVGDLQIMIGNDKEYLASRVSYKLDLKGPSCVVQTACSSSLVAVHVACQALIAGECDMALAGGSSVRMPPGGGYLHQPGGTSSPDGHCRAFDADAGGSVVGSGAGVVVLKHLQDALDDGDHVYAVIKGTAINNDGAAKVSFTAPSVEGQARAAAGALLAAEVGADEIAYVEAHGTGTPLGDPIEVAALTRAFRETTERVNYCAIGSVKTNIGHLDAAAGIAGFIKVVQAVRHGLVPATLHFKAPNPQIDFASSPFFVNDRLLDWPTAGPRMAAANSIGMGGTNAHVVVQEPPELPAGDPAQRGQLLPISARTPTALERSTANLARWLREHPGANLADVAATLQRGRRALPHRRALVVRDVEDAAYALEAPTSARTLTRHCTAPAAGVAFLFPGQGTQYPGMARQLYEDSGTFRDQVEACLGCLEDDLAEELRTLLTTAQPTAEQAERLRDTALAQPALFVVGYATARWLEALGIGPQALLGHSIGEIAAAAVAGVMELPDALAFVVARGRAMSELPPAAMLSVALGVDAVGGYLEPGVELAAINTPELVTLAGSSEAIEALQARLERDGAVARRLHVSHAFHSMLVEPALPALQAAAERMELRPPAIPIVSNLSGTWLADEQAVDPSYWVRHAREPVRFADGWATLAASPNLALVEVGPGGTLLALGRACATGAWAAAVPTAPGPGERDDARQTFLHALGALWTAGVAIDWDVLWRGSTRRRVPLPTYPFEHRRFWVDAVPAPSDAPAAGHDPLERVVSPLEWLFMPSWSQAPPVPPAEPQERTVLLLGDEDALAAGLAERLRAAGARVVRVVRSDGAAAGGDDAAHVLDAQDAAGWQRLFERLSGEGTSIDDVALLWTAAHDEPGDEADAIATMGPLLTTAAVVRALRRHAPAAATRVLVVTRGAHDVHGDERPRPSQASALAAASIVPQELSPLLARCVDLDPRGDDADADADALATELLSAPAGPPLVAHRARRRWTRRFVPLAAPDEGPSPALRQDAAWVLVGGLGFMGRTLARHLRERWGAHVTLLDSRTATPAELAELEQPEGSLELVTCDCADRAALSAALTAAVERHGRLDGVLFAAGPGSEAGASVLEELSAEALLPHVAARVQGLRALDGALDGLPVGACIVASSLATALGGIGGSAYMASSLWGEAFVAARNRDRAVPWTVVQWEHWRRPGEQSFGGLRERLAIEPSELVETFELAVRAAAERIAVSSASLDARVELAHRPVEPRSVDDEPEAVEAEGVHRRPEVGTPYVAPRTPHEQHVAGTACQLLGIDRVGVEDNFFELGADSLMAMQLVSNLRDRFGVPLPMSDLFQEPTVAALVVRIEEQLAGTGDGVAAAATEPRAPADAGADELDELLANVPADELERALAELDGAADELVADRDA